MIVDHRQHHLQWVRSTLSTVLYPLQYLANLPVTIGESISETLLSRDQMGIEITQLKQQNLLLQGKQQKMIALESENQRLRDLLGSSFKIGDRILIAELVAVDMDPYRHQVVINKGASSGVHTGQPVLDANAVMGQVIQTNSISSTVLMITDASHALPVRVNRNGLRTIAMGTGHINELNLPNLPNNADIQVGDQLVTSGLGGRFPPGYPVAEVTQIHRKPGHPFASIKARPSAKLDHSREVLLVWPLDTPELAITPDATNVAPEQSSGATNQ